MAMDTVLKQLESKIEELVKAYRKVSKSEAELTVKVKELEAKAASDTEMSSRCETLEKQRDELGKRLEKVLTLIDDTLSKTD